MTIRIETLGRLRVSREGRELSELPAQPVRCGLLLYLALVRGATRDELTALFWPEREAERARHSLSQTLYELRRGLGDEWVEARGERVEVTATLAVDALEFIDAIEAGRDEEALAVYGGPFLAGSHPGTTAAFESWAERHRSELARLHRDLCRRLTAARIAGADAAGALAVARRWAELDPLEDDAHHHIIALLAQSGRRSEALRHYDLYAELIARELEVEPLDETRQLVARIREGAAKPPPATEPQAGIAAAISAEEEATLLGKQEARGHVRFAASTSTRMAPLLRRASTAARGRSVLLGSLAAAVVAGMILLPARANDVPAPDTLPLEASLDPRGIAVLPFVNLSPDPEQEYFSDGITEDLLTSLSKIAELTVISRTSVMQYKGTSKSLREIGGELGVAHILEGSVRRAGDRVRITAQLIDAHTDAHLWAATYDRELTDIFAVQSEIAQRIADALRAQLTPTERERLERAPTRSLSAYDFYLQGREFYHRFTRRENELAIELFRRAIQADPSFALAYAGLADAYAQKAIRFNEPREWTDSAVAMARRAVSLDPQSAEAHKALGVGLMTQQSYSQALAALERALELNPNFAPAVGNIGILHAFQGRYDEGLRWQRRAMALQPAARAQQLSNIAAVYVWLGAFGPAEQALAQALALQPDFAPPRVARIYVSLRQGRTAEAVERGERLVLDGPGDVGFLAAAGEAQLLAGDLQRASKHFERAYALSTDGRIPGFGRDMRVLLAYTLLETGQRDRGVGLLRAAMDRAHLEIRRGSEAAWDRYTLAAAYALLGDRDAAYHWLLEATAAGWTDYLLLARDPAFGSLHGEADFQRIVARNRAEIERQRARVEREGW